MRGGGGFCAVGGDEVVGEDGAEGSGGAGDEDGAVVPAGRFGVGITGAGEAWGEEGAAAEGELGFACREEGGGRDFGAGLHIGQDDPAGVFGLCDSDESGDAGGGEVGDVLAVSGDGTPGDDEKRSVRPALVGEEVLDCVQGVVQDFPS